ncbi:MAG: indole-3-glycerol phosphate synthase TrpC [Chloroflexota bacterium]|nr:indole-3-glycerol phosphate synthase TrpC [Chloroflexota bacterium]MDE2841487.1 indole-3-glycerol phosphate synthase TrpC [Chloroflexota bacterium]MDE2929862.1 indole-3-glycerol phosphate synthase TrpC [Chloroflexota bacterium]
MILDTILQHKERELAERQAAVPLRVLERSAEAADPPRDFAAALRQDGIRLIAEIKRASPSKGVFAPDLDPAALAQTYADNGASALSVLTDERFFQGSLGDLTAARAAVNIPALRKDFTTDEYHIVEARAAGADAVLLIVAALPQPRLRALLRCAQAWSLAAIVEVHTAEETAQALEIDAEIIGINNRNLHTFETTLETTAAIRALIPSDHLVVSESGIHTPADVARLHAWNVDAMLIGEALVTASDTAAKVASLVAAVNLPTVDSVASDSTSVIPAKAGIQSEAIE